MAAGLIAGLTNVAQAVMQAPEQPTAQTAPSILLAMLGLHAPITALDIQKHIET